MQDFEESDVDLMGGTTFYKAAFIAATAATAASSALFLPTT